MTEPRPEAPPGAFGKLPLTGDFVAVNAGGPVVRGFTEWLQEGVGQGHGRLAGGWDVVFPAMPPWRFLLTAGPAGPALAGSLVPGRDRSGRRFPFSLFAGVSPDGLGALLERSWPFLARAEAEALRLVELGEAPGPAPLRPVAEAVEGLQAEVPPAGAGGGTSRTAPGLDAFAGLGGDPAAVVARVGANLFEVAGRLGPGRVPGYGLRIPVPGRDGDGAEALGFWLGLIGRAFRDGSGPRALFWTGPAEGRPGLADVYFQAPGTTAFLHLVDPGFESEALYPLDESDPRRPGERARAWQEAIRGAAGSGTGLEELLARLDRRG